MPRHDPLLIPRDTDPELDARMTAENERRARRIQQELDYLRTDAYLREVERDVARAKATYEYYFDEPYEEPES